MVFELVIFGTLHFPLLREDIIIRRDSRYFSVYADCQKAIDPALDDLAREAQVISTKRKQYAKADYYIGCKALPGQMLTLRRALGPA